MLFIGHTRLIVDMTSTFISEVLPQMGAAIRAHDVVLVVIVPTGAPRWCAQMLAEAQADYPFLLVQRELDAPPIVDRIDDYAINGLYGVYHLHMDDLVPAVYFDYMGEHIREQHVGMVVIPGGDVPPVTIGGAMKVCKGAPETGTPLQVSSLDDSTPIISDEGIPAPLKAGPRRYPMMETSVP